MNNSNKQVKELKMILSNIFTNEKINDIINIYKSNDNYYSKNNSNIKKNHIHEILINSFDKKLIDELLKEYDIKNKNDKYTFKTYIDNFKNNNEVILKENLKLLINSYDLYRRNKINLGFESNVLEQKSKLEFKNINFGYIFENNEKLNKKKNNYKYQIGSSLFDKIATLNEILQIGGRMELNKSNSNKTLKDYKVKLLEISGFSAKQYVNNNNDIDLNNIIQFYYNLGEGIGTQSDDSLFGNEVTYFPYYINILDGLVGKSNDYVILNNEYNIYKFSNNVINFLEKKVKDKDNKLSVSSSNVSEQISSNNLNSFMSGGKKKENKPKKNSSQKSKPKMGPLEDINKILTSMKKITDDDNELSTKGFKKIKEKLFRHFYNGDDELQSLQTVISNGNCKNPFYPIKKWDENFINKYNDKYYTNLVNQFDRFRVNKSEQEKKDYRNLFFNTFLRTILIDKELLSQYDIITLEKELDKKYKKSKKKNGKSKSGGALNTDSLKLFYDNLNVFQVCYLYSDLENIDKYKRNSEKNKDIINFKENVRKMNYYLKLEICKYYIYISILNLIKSLKTNEVLILSYKKYFDFDYKINLKREELLAIPQNKSKKNEAKNKDEVKNKNEVKNKKVSNSQMKLFVKIDDYFNKQYSNVNKNSIKYKKIEMEKQKLKDEIMSLSEKNAITHISNFIKSKSN